VVAPPAQQALPVQAPHTPTSPSPTSILLPPSPLTPLSSAPESEKEDEQEVEQELAPPGSFAPQKQKAAQPTEPMQQSTCITKPSYYLRYIEAGEGTAEGTNINMVQCVFDAEFDNLIAGAILDA
jgi:hypothetical protein